MQKSGAYKGAEKKEEFALFPDDVAWDVEWGANGSGKQALKAARPAVLMKLLRFTVKIGCLWLFHRAFFSCVFCNSAIASAKALPICAMILALPI